MDKTKQSIVFALLAAFGFSIQDTAVKAITADSSIWQLMFIRSLIVVAILVAFALITRSKAKILPKTFFWPVLRAVFMTLAYSFFYASLPFLALSEASSCFFMAPIFVCILARLFLGEKIGWVQKASVALGFIGALIIIQPGLISFRPILLLPVLAGLSYAVSVVVTRGFCRDEPNLSLTIIHNVIYAFLGLFVILLIPKINLHPDIIQNNSFIFKGWVEITMITMMFILLTALTHLMSMSASIFAYKNQKASLIAPIEYTYLIFAVMIDYWIWQFLPSLSHAIGAILIFISGVIVTKSR